MTSLTSQQINILKYLAVFTMLLDHIAQIILPSVFPLIMIGRTAFVIFAFILVYNYIHNTSNKLNYIKRLFVFGLISQPFYLFAFEGPELNIFITLAIGLLVIYLSEEKIKQNPKLNQKMMIVSLSAMFILAEPYINMTFLGIMLIGMIYCYLEESSALNLAIIIALAFLINFISQQEYSQGLILGLCSASAYLIILLVSKININAKIPTNKWLFFIFYPLHIFVLKLIELI